MYSILFATFISALYYTVEEAIQSNNCSSTIIEDPFTVQDFTTTTNTECVDITLQNQIPVTMTQEQFITFTNYNSDYSVIYSTLTTTITQETFSVETFITSTCSSFEVNQLSVSTEPCLSENVSVYTTDVFVLNSVDCHSTSTEELTTSLFGDLEGLPITTTTILESTTTDIIGDLEGLPTILVNDTLPEITIEEIPDTEVPEIRDNGLQFCAAVGLGDVVANGTQQQFQTCSLTVQGAIPAIDKMVSTIIISPENNANIVLGTNFTITIKSLNIEYGFFDDPASLYYLSPQRLNEQGIIQGHNHVAIQKLLGPGEVPSAQNPLFFKGLNEQSLDGTLSTEVNGALFTETGEYRLCTSSASQGHQPVLSPVARRFFQDDCIRFTIVN